MLVSKNNNLVEQLHKIFLAMFQTFWKVKRTEKAKKLVHQNLWLNIPPSPGKLGK